MTQQQQQVLAVVLAVALLSPTAAFVIMYPPTQLRIESRKNNVTSPTPPTTTTTPRVEETTTTSSGNRTLQRICLLPPVPDPDNRAVEPEMCDPTKKSPKEMYTYNNISGKCQPYLYEGCWGTENLFPTEDACQLQCDTKRWEFESVL